MKRILTLVVVMGLFYLTMSSFSSAQQKADKSNSENSATVQSAKKQDQVKSNYDRDDLKTGLTRAFYDALTDVENDLEDEEVEGQDGKKHSALEEARRTIFQADRILARIKAENKKALVKLRNPPRRIIPGQKQLPKKKSAKKNEQTLKKQIEAQEKLIKQQQQKLNHLKKELVAAPAKS
ncbi:MAG: hypothetical protein K0U86_16380 [Planctomycetes bacterium]|nr:hypothetical protein [Planctomycetota bacterium]MCH9726479.1 hypothetical protein [Planctomycetota bacterium]MCH9778288.1 hypothetical protein [Planctomycetota bacterium]MDF1743658.1 hypothetical protein [Gimesia sp.]